MSTPCCVSPQEAAARLEANADATLLDVRTPAEHRAIHAANATNVPLDQLTEQKCASLTASGGRAIYVICKSGSRARMAAERLCEAGHPRVFVVEGGTDAWAQHGLPVERGAEAISLERQVRIAAGSIAALGAALALVVHPYFAGVPLFVGCGLVFAGVTDTCAMGMLLARMPWNR